MHNKININNTKIPEYIIILKWRPTIILSIQVFKVTKTRRLQLFVLVSSISKQFLYIIILRHKTVFSGYNLSQWVLSRYRSHQSYDQPRYGYELWLLVGAKTAEDRVAHHSAEYQKTLNEQSAGELEESSKVNDSLSQEQRSKLNDNIMAQLVGRLIVWLDVDTLFFQYIYKLLLHAVILWTSGWCFISVRHK